MPRPTYVLTAALVVSILLIAACHDEAKSPHGPPETSTVESEQQMRVGEEVDKGSHSENLLINPLSSPTLDRVSLARSVAGPGIPVGDVSFTGAEVSAGSFEGGAEVLGFERGIVLSSGEAATAHGPNESDAATEVINTDGDDDLTALAGQPTFDATILEFDFVPEDDEIVVQFVFGSEEYNEFVNSQFVDVFAIFVNGQLCEFVTINSVNNGNPFGSEPSSNPGLYRNNDLSDGGGTIDTEMDGLTEVLICEASVNPDVTNHMKLAIADASDRILDSWVFLSSGVPCVGSLNERAACLASLTEDGPYTFGAKGWDYNAECTDPVKCQEDDEVPGESRFLDDDEIQEGLHYDYWDAEPPPLGGGFARGDGVDCSGLVLWSYEKAIGSTDAPGTGEAIEYEGADGQHDHNTEHFANRDLLRPGDLLFFDLQDSDDTSLDPVHIDHVAMYVGDNQVVEAFNTEEGIIRTSLDDALDRDDFVTFGRLDEADVDFEIQGLSPVDLMVSDPDGLFIDALTLIVTNRELLREVPGHLYYSEGADIDNDGSADDIVYGPELKEGDYVIKVVPEAGASPGDDYTLVFKTDAETIILDQNVPVGAIPPEGYGVRVTTGGLMDFDPLSVDVKPGSDPNSANCANTRGVLPVAVLSTSDFDATHLDAGTVRFGKTGTEAAETHRKRGQAKRHVEDVNDDGLMELVFHFRFGETGFSCGDVPAGQRTAQVIGRLSGEDHIGSAFTGLGSVNLIRGGRR